LWFYPNQTIKSCQSASADLHARPQICPSAVEGGRGRGALGIIRPPLSFIRGDALTQQDGAARDRFRVACSARATSAGGRTVLWFFTGSARHTARMPYSFRPCTRKRPRYANFSMVVASLRYRIGGSSTYIHRYKLMLGTD
jgi:hypothetical protein